MALPELPEWYATGVAFPKGTGDYKPFNSRAWSISLWGMAGLPYTSKLYSLNRHSVLRLQQVYSPKTESPASAVPLFPSLLPSGTISHPFLQEDISKVQNPEREPGRGGAMGSKLQHVPSLPGHNRATPIPAEACSQPLHFSQSTKPVQPETGLPALTCPRNAALVRNVSGKAEGPWNQSPSLGTYQTRAIINTGMCKAGRGVRVRRGGVSVLAC